MSAGVFLLLGLLACGRDQPSPPVQHISAPVPMTQTAVPRPDPVAVIPVVPAERASPEELYAKCEQRVEGAEVDGECASDEECANAGCGGEVCTTTSAAAGLTTTCEARLCFQVLENCGCSEGRCRWSLASEAPALPRVKLQFEPPEAP